MLLLEKTPKVSLDSHKEQESGSGTRKRFCSFDLQGPYGRQDLSNSFRCRMVWKVLDPSTNCSFIQKAVQGKINTLYRDQGKNPRITLFLQVSPMCKQDVESVATTPAALSQGQKIYGAECFGMLKYLELFQETFTTLWCSGVQHVQVAV